MRPTVLTLSDLLDTAIHEPPFDAIEVDHLLFSVERVRDEYARHVGHADLLREAIDGLVDEDPPQR